MTNIMKLKTVCSYVGQLFCWWRWSQWVHTGEWVVS